MIALREATNRWQERAGRYLTSDCGTCGGSMYYDAPHPDPSFARRGVTVMQPCPVCNPDEKPHCDTCGDLGYITYNVPVGDPQFGKPVPCPANCGAVAQQQQERLARLTRYSKLTEEYRGCTFATFDDMPDNFKTGKLDARRAAQLFVETADQRHWIQANWISGVLGDIPPDEMRNWLIFYGRHGVGKTGMAAAIVNALAQMGIPALYIRLQDLIQSIQRRYREDYAELGERDDFERLSSTGVQDEAKYAPILVLDEWFVSNERAKESQNKRDILQAIMRYRAMERLPTVITTNYTLDVLETAWETVTVHVVKQRSFVIPMTGFELRPGEAVFPGEGA